MDREKVIAWLADTELYYRECGKTADDLYQSQMANEALVLLKEQEAVKPWHKCIGNEYTLIEDSHFDFCPYCGKPIDWEGR